METHAVAPPTPPNCGKRLLSSVIDERAQNGHERAFASIPCNSNKADYGYLDVSYNVFANAINKLAHWMRNEIGAPARDCESLVYIAPADLRYQIVMMAAVKAGYITFLPSPRNSAEAFDSLLKESGATKLVTANPPPPAVGVMQKCRAMQQFTIPSLDELLDSTTSVPHIPLRATWEEYRFRPFVQIHSSGSTGTPKLITLKHGSFTALDGFQLLESNELAQRLGNMRKCVAFPPFHIAGIIYGLAIPIWVDSTIIIPPAVPLTAAVVNSVHEAATAEFALMVPSLVIDLTKNPSYLRNLRKLKGVTFAGGPLPESVGEQLVKYTRLYAGYGASEWMAAPQLPKPKEDWPYFRFNEEQGGMEFRERDKGLFEMVLCRRTNYELSQPVFITFPDIDAFESRDLFSKHPTKPGMWKYTSRLDDIIVFSNGEKLNPVTLEGRITSSPDVKGCLLVGHGRFSPTLLIEPQDPNLAQEELVDRIWPHIQMANESTVRHGRVAKDCLFLTSPSEPLPRAGKGTIQRAAANALYAQEIDDVYARLQTAPSQDHSVINGSRKIDLTSLESTEATLFDVVSNDIGLEGLDTTSDFFALGMDSLQVVNIVRGINAVRPNDPIDAKQIYDNPSIDQLSRYLHSASPPVHDGYDSDEEELKESWLAMDRMFKDLTAERFPVDQRHHRWRHLDGFFRPKDSGPVVQPDGGRVAWLQVLAMFLVNVNNWGLVNSFGVFQAFYQTEWLSTYSPSAIAWIGTLQGTLLLLIGVISGPLFDKGYFKLTLTIASVGLVFALMMLSLSTRFYQVLLTQGILCGICSGLLYIPSIALVPVYFKHRRGLALGLATGGGSVGGVVYPIVFRKLLAELGFPWAVRVMAFIALLTLGVAVVLAKPIGARIRRQLIDVGAFAEPYYVMFLCSAFFLLAAMFVPFFLSTTFSLQHLHASPSLSFYLVSVVNAAQLFGRILPAWSSDHLHRYLGPEAYLFIGEFMMAFLAFCWIAVHNVGGFVAWLIFYGFFSGMAVTLPALVLPHISPSFAVYGTRLGVLYGCAGLGFLISTPIATAANSSTGGFLGSQVWTGVSCLVASLLFVGTGLEVRKRRLLYEIGKRRRMRQGGTTGFKRMFAQSRST